MGRLPKRGDDRLRRRKSGKHSIHFPSSSFLLPHSCQPHFLTFPFPVSRRLCRCDFADVTVTTDCDTEFAEYDADATELHFGAAENTENRSAPPTTSPLLDLEQLRD